MGINATFDLNKFIDQYINFNSGITFFNALFIIFIIILAFYFIGKSGLLSGLREHSEYKRKKIKYTIEDQEELLKDESLKDFKKYLEYHLKVTKLGNYLKFKENDIDLLKYIISCRNKNKAIRLYSFGQKYIEKDNSKFRLKKGLTNKKIKKSVLIGDVLYFSIASIGALPFLSILIVPLFFPELRMEINQKLMTPSIILFLVFLFIALLVLWKYLKPEAAQNFLELEKISPENNEQN
ncbi:hypothetical protein [Acinetobacter bereziniae]|uniref:hypothetical protein n=1 Tax=Acinetobacter bereziniae TaxID=106648 RepID=UPI0018FFE211|nr:hypothetical protein [Acinetobacter bereziniae]MBJ9903654.1 hypothetical protein [Acinetobacter bereziniae]MCU4321657.1 hypothetical protein [Acinetobacter bereziniae]MCU4601308.1 hypothetical protein [Acinetobacter bereziniae]